MGFIGEHGRGVAEAQGVIDDCDYYILIVGGRYGSTTAEGISFTEMEFDYAVSKGIHVIAFLHGQPDLIPVGRSDIEPKARKKLEEFRDRVSKDRLVKFWNSTAELPGLVALSLSKAMKAYPRPGWVRGGSASSSELLEQINELRQKNDELQRNLVTALSERRPADELNLAPSDSQFLLKGKYFKIWRVGGKSGSQEGSQRVRRACVESSGPRRPSRAMSRRRKCACARCRTRAGGA